MPIVAVTQRVDVVQAAHGATERRDGLDQAWFTFLAAADCIPVPLPNRLPLARRMLEELRRPELFEAVMEDLSFREVLLAQRLELDREKLRLHQEMEPRNYELAKRRVDLLEGKLSDAKETQGNTTLTNEEKRERIRQIFGLA